MNVQSKNLYLKPEEAGFNAMAVMSMLEILEAKSKDVRINWTPEARRLQKEMIAAGTSLKLKMKNLGFDMRPLPPFLDGDEHEFLTKES
jgi:hypothetical protein